MADCHIVDDRPFGLYTTVCIHLDEYSVTLSFLTVACAVASERCIRGTTGWFCMVTPDARLGAVAAWSPLSRRTAAASSARTWTCSSRFNIYLQPSIPETRWSTVFSQQRMLLQTMAICSRGACLCNNPSARSDLHPSFEPRAACAVETTAFGFQHALPTSNNPDETVH